jgi:hypothetical protein
MNAFLTFISLGGITRPGSLGMFSAFSIQDSKLKQHPFEMGQR